MTSNWGIKLKAITEELVFEVSLDGRDFKMLEIVNGA